MADTKQLIFKLLDKTVGISYLPIYSELTNSLSAGILLSYLMLKWKMNEDTIFTITDAELMKILRLKLDRLRHAKKQLQKLTVVHITHDKVNHQSAYDINQEKLIELLIQTFQGGETPGAQGGETPGAQQILGKISLNKSIPVILSPLLHRGVIITREEHSIENTGKESLGTTEPLEVGTTEPGTTLQPTSEPIEKLTNTEKVEFIFDFWNEFKGGNKPGTIYRWQAHNKLTPLIGKAILQALEEATNLDEENHLEICHAIENYAKVLLSEETFYTHVWPLQVFLTVHETNKSTSMKKWQKFLNTNFVYSFYLANRPTSVPKHDEALCLALIRQYGKNINNPQFKALGIAEAQFAAGSILAKSACAKYHLSVSDCLDYFFQMLEKEFINEGQAILPGHIASHTIWEIRFPQFLSNQGLY